jgi:superoxide dismutase, Cu-Zn family
MQRSFFFASVIALGACATVARTIEDEVRSASAVIRTPDGTQIGVLALRQGDAGVRVAGQLSGLPAGAHGLHVHATGRCDGPDFSTAGGHFNPRATKHGLLNPEGPHAGDLPAIAADVNGRAVVDVTTAGITLDSGAIGLFDSDGSAIVVHAASDDQRTDPSGNSGARIACGTVQRP